ncbi:MAG: glycosyltransferase family 4 protein, partial [Deltaproteobacteria bacterium]|nr:glycosyltransferase family 4 protein [Deltaproteobacteria bacterium]MBI3294218.1 glycosyltransferase family 4 protein [Deltaproteobacteria bacterium]
MKRIAIGVGGRFHSESLFHALTAAGHEVRLFSSYPKSRIRVPRHSLTTFPLAEIGYQLGRLAHIEDPADRFKMGYLGRRILEQVQALAPDVFIGWSSFSLETLRARPATTHILIRDSTHISFQNDILAEEYRRRSIPFPKREFCSRRELEEYEKADQIWVLSDFARSTFLERGLNERKISVLPLGVDLRLFVPRPHRKTTLPIRVVSFGTLSVRKGLHYLLEAMERLPSHSISLTLIGHLEPEFRKILTRSNRVDWIPALKQSDLAQKLPEFDVAVVPTLEDGFGQSVVQAMASGLVPVVTKHCGASSIIEQGVNGFVVEPGNSDAIASCLRELISSPEKIAGMAESARAAAQHFTWERYANRSLALLEEHVNPCVRH